MYNRIKYLFRYVYVNWCLMKDHCFFFNEFRCPVEGCQRSFNEQVISAVCYEHIMYRFSETYVYFFKSSFQNQTYFFIYNFKIKQICRNSLLIFNCVIGLWFSWSSEYKQIYTFYNFRKLFSVINLVMFNVLLAIHDLTQKQNWKTILIIVLNNVDQNLSNLYQVLNYQFQVQQTIMNNILLIFHVRHVHICQCIKWISDVIVKVILHNSLSPLLLIIKAYP